MTAHRLPPALQGGVLALLAATLFGLSTPLVQRWGAGMGPFGTAAALYAGAAGLSLWFHRPATREARLRRSDTPRLLAMAGMGAVLGPVALAWGLQHTSGASASLMLTLEAVVTALIAWRWYGEEMDRRVSLAMVLLLSGGVLLVLEQSQTSQARLWGLLAVGLSTCAWGVDNALSRGVAERDPGQVVFAKATLGACISGALAWGLAEPRPTAIQILALLAIGATGYGMSLRLYLLAQRSFGAARTASVFAFAPFIGTLGAYGLGERNISWWLLTGGTLMLAGVLLHLFERHGHEHQHPAQEHEHAHRHDDGHHLHHHDVMPNTQHSHWHRHPPMHHSHPHTPDVHHQHRH